MRKLKQRISLVLTFLFMISFIPDLKFWVKAEINPMPVDTAVTLVGNIISAAGLGEDWKPENDKGLMKEYKDGLYELTLNFASAKTDGQYKIAINRSWDVSYGKDGQNVPINIPANSKVIFRFNSKTKEAYDSINNPDKFKTSATLVGTLAQAGGQDWKPGDSNFDLDYIGGGFYKKSFTLKAGNYEYKVAYNHDWSNGEVGNNVALKLTEDKEVTFLANPLTGDCTDSVSNPEILNTVSLVGTIRGGNSDWDQTLRGYEFSHLSGDGKFVYSAFLTEGTKDYKAISNYDWNRALPASNKTVVVPAGGKYIVIIADFKNNVVYDSINDSDKIAEILGLEAPVASPVIDRVNGTVTFNYKDASAGKVVLAGTMLGAEGWGANSKEMIKDSKGIWSFSMELSKGDYEYKFVVDGNWITDPSNSTIKNGNSAFTMPLVVKSPVVNSNGTATFRAVYDGETLNLVGSMNGWDNKGIAMTKNADGVFEVTIQLNPGVYEYKYFPVSGSWDNGFTDPSNPRQANGNSQVVVPGLRIINGDTIEGGTTVDLTARIIKADGSEAAANPTWSLKSEINGVTLEGNKLTAAKTLPNETVITVVAEQEGVRAEKEIKVLQQMYTFNINYYRYDGKPDAWDLWIWMDGKDGTANAFTSVTPDGFGQVTVKYPVDHINIIPRTKGAWTAQESTKVATVQSGASVDVYLLQDSDEVFYEKPDVSPRVTSALMDSVKEVIVSTSAVISDEVLQSFKLADRTDGKEIAVTAARLKDTSVKLTVTDGTSIAPDHLYEVSANSFAAGKVTMRKILDDGQYFYEGSDLGLSFNYIAGTGSDFKEYKWKLWAPTAKKVQLFIYSDAAAAEEAEAIEMIRGDKGVWSVNKQGILDGKYYMYMLTFADDTTKLAVDPYARSVSINGKRTAIVDLKDTNPIGFKPAPKPTMVKPTDAVLYEMHVRDFSVDESSGIDAKGKFKAFTEEGTTLPEDSSIKTGVDHLKELGITHVHLLPSYDYKSVDEASDKAQFNWGYDPQNYNVPEGYYSTDAANPTARVKEFKELVEALHRAGIRVVMDVVYNHTFEVGNSPFDSVVPGYFYRTNDAGKYTNGSGCGNEVASERPMVRKYIKDSVRYWVDEYGVDGFRFDLMGLIDTTTMTQLTKEIKEEIDPTILIYGEPWTGGSTPLPGTMQTTKGAQKDKNFAVFNDNFRGAIKGDSDGAGQGFATGASGKEADIIKGVRGAIDDFTNGPTETINYVTAHDNLNLWDKVVVSQGLNDESNFLNLKDGGLTGEDATKYSSIEEAVSKSNPYYSVDSNNILGSDTVRRALLANGIVLTSQGIPFFQAGDEMLKTKYGDHNSYKSPDIINNIKWANKKEFKPVFDYHKGLIELRKSHPAFRMDTKAAIESNLQVVRADGNVVVFELKNFANGDSWKNIVVVYNANTTVQTVNLPSTADWKLVVDHTAAGTSVIREIPSANKVSVEPLSMMVLYDEAETAYTPVPTRIELSRDTLALEAGKSAAVTAYVRDQLGRIMVNEKVLWTVLDTSIAAVDAAGKITALRDGSTKVIASLGDLKAELTLNVGALIPATITLSGDSVVFETQAITLSAEVRDQYKQIMFNQPINWTSSDETVASVNTKGEVSGIKPGTVTITAKLGELSASKTIEVKKYEKRFIRLTYTRPDKNYEGWNLWVWGTGVQDDQIDFTVNNGAAVANIEVAPNTSRVGFIVRKGNWEAKDVESDRYITLEPNQTLTKVYVTSGQAEFHVVPAVTAPVIDKGIVTFNYRDEYLYKNDQMGTFFESVKLKINGNEYPMTYIEEDELFTYSMSIEPGTYEYTYVITDKQGNVKEITDPNNTADGKSTITYIKPIINITAKIQPSELTSNQNAVVSLELASNMAVKAKEIYLDLTEIGGGSKVAVDTALNAQTISVRDNIPAGEKKLPVLVIDEYGNEHKGEAQVTVKTRQAVGELDFDYDEARIYFMVTDRFFNGDTSNDDPDKENYDKINLETYHGGDFKGVTSKLDYLKNLGINTIWISPIVDNIDFNVGAGFGGTQYGYHGYWAKDFESIDEHLGELEDFKALLDAAHERGIKVMVDVVLNHAGYGMKDSDTNTNNVSNFPTEEEQAKFDGMLRDGGTDQVQGELSGLPDFKTEDPAVREKLINWQTAWISKAKTEKGNTIDYFRVDTVKHVEHTTWKAFKNALTTLDPNFKLIGEYFNANVNDQDALKYLRSGEMDSLLDFSFKYSAVNFINGQIDGVEGYMEEINGKIDNTASFAKFLSSHDEDGFLTRISGTEEEKLAKLKLAAALQITAKGQPVIYYGEELGLSGRNAGDMSQGQLSENRYDMAWERLDNPLYKSVYDHYAKLLNTRAEYSKIFAKGTRTKLAGSDADKYLIFERAYEGKSVIVGLNTAEEKTVTIKVPFAAGTYVQETFTGKVIKVGAEGKVTVILPAVKDGGTLILAESKIIPVEGVSISKTLTTIKVGESETLAAVITNDNATNKAVTWSSSDEAVATVKDGVVTAVSAGKAIITVKTEDGGFTASCEVTVVVPVTGVSLNKAYLTVKPGESSQLTATVWPLNATNKGVKWESSNPAVAVVDENGKVTGKAIGTAVITVTTLDGGFTDKVNVAVVKVPVKSFKFNTNFLVVTKGEAAKINYKANPGNASVKDVAWTTMGANVGELTADDNKVTLNTNNVGVTTIVGTTLDSGYTDACVVVVIPDLRDLFKVKN